MNVLHTFFTSVGFAGEDLAKIVSAFEFKSFKRDEYFVEEGKLGLTLGFIEEGLFQYYILVNGNEKTTYVAQKNGFLASLVSFLNEVPAKENIRVISPTASLWVIPKNELKKLIAEIPGFKDFYIGLLEYQVCCIDESRLGFISLKGEERYEKMLRTEPELLKNIPLHYLSSIIGVTPRHMSRIRKNIV